MKYPASIFIKIRFGIINKLCCNNIDVIHYAKTHTAERSKALYKLNDAKIKIGATATPITKDPRDVYGIYKFIKPDLLGKVGNFQKRYINFAGYGRINGFKNVEELKDIISNNIFVKTKREVADQLPHLQCLPIYIDLTAEQIMKHDEMMAELEDLNKKDFQIRSQCKSENEALLNVELQQINGKIMALQTFAQELTDSPLLLATSESDYSRSHSEGLDMNTNPKLDMCLELIEQILEAEEKVCIFSKFERMQKILTDAINKKFNKKKEQLKIAYVNGSLNSDQRYIEAYDKFRDTNEYKILLCSDAGAEGLNLSECKYLIEYDLATSYAIQTQRQGRLERADSIHKNVFVYQLIGNDSWDMIQQKIIEKKEGFDNNIIKSLAKK
jgi:ERCC4-related helicase